MKQRPSRHSRAKRSALQLGVLLVALSFQINIIFADVPFVYNILYLVLLGSFITVVSGNLSRRDGDRMVIIFTILMIAGAITGQPLKYIGLGVAVCFGYFAARDYAVEFERIMIWLFFVNFFVTASQFFGVSDVVYQFQNYANLPAVRQSVFDNGFGITVFLPQTRPSGIFPAPTFVSAYTVLLFAYLSSARHKRSIVFVLAGVWIAMLGSTLGLLLVAGAISLAVKRPGMRYLILGYVVAMASYMYYMPIQFEYNFSYANAEQSVRSRIDLGNLEGESIIQSNQLALTAIIAIFMVGILVALFLIFSRSNKLIRNGLESVSVLIPFGIAVMLPALVHDISFSLFYWFILGVAFTLLQADAASRRRHLVRVPSRA